MGFILFAIIIIRPNISFAISRLIRFNVDSKKRYHQATNKAIQYLYGTKELTLRYKNDIKARLFIYASDALFIDNIQNRKSSQGYIILLFKESIA